MLDRLLGRGRIMGWHTPNAWAVGPVTVQSLVDDVPGVAFVGPVRDEIVDVVLHDGSEGFGVPCPVYDPVGKLIGPDEVVAAEVFAMVSGNVDGNVSTGIIEDVLFGLSGEVLHVVG